jgi:hypothetical protein
MQETITLTTQEQKRVMILKRILARQLSIAEATALLKRSKRQVPGALLSAALLQQRANNKY